MAIYLQPKIFLAEYNKSIEKGEPTDKLINYFEKIAKKFATTFEYKNKIDFDACINYAVTEAWIKWAKYDTEKSENMFSFFTTMISNDLRIHYKQITKGKKTSISIEALMSSTDK